ncbi:MAG: dihydroxyacetone kinase subunit DhaK [Glaciihabitans sp.]|nr:dihydroxyacetone kinase subunit DhaK [Glaciihabitans sp.]
MQICRRVSNFCSQRSERPGVSLKKLINDPKDVVVEGARGFAAAHADIVTVEFDPLFIRRVDAPIRGKVALISGGGSGHEPLHGGFVGYGMLDAAVPGAVFTSPTPDPIVAAAAAVNAGAGVLQIVKNYTGDVLNFETAGELSEAEGIAVRTVIINDDVAVKDSLYTAGRRGVAGTVLVEKIAGASAQRGDDLDSVAAIATRVNDQVRSMGVALTPCVVPHAGEPSFTLADDEIEIGIGIHGEPGRERIALEPADRIVDRLLSAILEDMPLASGDEVLLFVNGMGGTPQIELYIVYRRAEELLAAQGIIVSRTLVGNFVTSLEMQGASITVLKLDDELTELWDAPVQTAALRWGR